MNKQAINTIVIPQLNTIKENITTAVDGIPNADGIYDETGAIQSAYNTYVARIKRSVSTIISLNMITGITEAIDKEIESADLAMTNAESTFSA